VNQACSVFTFSSFIKRAYTIDFLHLAEMKAHSLSLLRALAALTSASSQGLISNGED
jgi:hypothetical protein